MLKYLLFFIVLFSLSFIIEKESKVEWSTRRLTWEQYTGPINPRSSGIASTYSYMDMHIVSVNSDSAEVNLVAVFLPNESWVSYKEETVLSHENGHFDITELYARILRKKIKETVFSATQFKSQLRKIYFEYDDKMDKYHDKYDDETEGSMNGKQQDTWEEKIKLKLEELKDFTAKKVVVKF